MSAVVPAGRALAAVREANARLAPISLEEVLRAAELQTRVDRKYLVSPDAFTALMDGVAAEHRVLQIDSLRDFRYESVYFDTPELTSYHLAARGRRNKFKVRTRTYLDSDTCMLEVKSVGRRNQTVKERMDYATPDRTRLSPKAAKFVEARVVLPDGAGSLAPVLTTTYARATLVDPLHGSRMTCDTDLRLVDRFGGDAQMTDRVLVETKSAGAPLAADRILWRLGVRPLRLSKYCVGMARLDPALPSNRWHRTLRRHFH